MNSPENKRVIDIDKPAGRRKRSLPRGLVLQLITIVILPLSVLLIITTFAGLTLHQQSMRELAAERDERTVRSAANTLGELIQQRVDITRKLAQDAKSGSSSEELAALLDDAAELSGISDASLAYVDARGKRLASTGDRLIWEDLDAEAFVDLLDDVAPGGVVTQLMPIRNNGNRILVVLVSSPDGSNFAVSAFAPTKLIERSLQGVFPSGGNNGIYVVAPDLQVLYHFGEGDLAEPLIDHPGVRQALENQSGSTYMKVGNDEHVVAYSPVQPIGWALVIEEPWAEIASRMLRVTENAPLALIPIVVLAVLALWFSSRYVVRPLQSLEALAVELGWGNYQAIEESVGGIEEIHNLQIELIHLAHKVRAAQKGLRDYIGAITLGQEDERRRLARELHDDTLQSLIALNQRLQLYQLTVEETPQTSRHIETLHQVQSLAEQTIQDLRRITRALRPVYLEDLGLVAALEMLSREIDQAHGLAVGFKSIGSEIRLAPEVELALYRIAQEALNNAVKHAEADHANVQVMFEPELVTLEVCDDGKGFDVPESPAAFAPGGHFGLLGLVERAEMIGAKLEISSRLGEGCQIIVKLARLSYR